MQTGVWVPFVVMALFVAVSRVLLATSSSDMGQAVGHLLAAAAAIPLVIGLYRVGRWARGMD